MASTRSCCPPRTVSVPSRKETNASGSPTTCQLLWNTVSHSSSPTISVPPTRRRSDRQTVRGLFKKTIQISATAITQISCLGLGYSEIPSIWPPPEQKISFEDQRIGVGKKQGRDPQKISGLCSHQPSRRALLLQLWLEPSHTVSRASMGTRCPALQDGSDSQQSREQGHRTCFSNSFAAQ